MTPPVRLSAVSFVNARPLVHGLDSQRALFAVDYDLPSECAARLHAGEVDLGLIPAIEYLGGDYRLVPGMAIGSDGSRRCRSPACGAWLWTRVHARRSR
jgi:predicted solute-binding protein